MMIPIFVINLERSPVRWEAMKDQFCLDELTRIDAVDGRAESKEASEIACAQSHMKVWSKIVDEEIDMAIVFEDDVQPVNRSISVKDAFYNMAGRLDFDVMFIQDSYKCSYLKDANNNYLAGWGAHGYAITKEGAKKSIDAMTPIMLPVDVQWMMSFRETAMFCTLFKPNKNINAKVSNMPIIKHSKQASKTTFSADGEKPWTDNRYKGGF